MILVVFSVIAVVGYAAATAMYAGDLIGDSDPVGDRGRVWLLAGAMANAAYIGLVPLYGAPGGATVLDSGNLSALLGLVIVSAFLLVRTRFPVRTVGAAVSPIAALLVGLAAIRPTVLHVNSGLPGTALLVTHVSLALAGLGAFVLAALLSTVYLIQERELRARRFGRLVQRLPSLDALDASAFRLIGVGFVVYSVAVVLGAIQASRLHHSVFDTRVVLAIVAWLVFAGVIFTRLRTGWRGRQAAFLTILGCTATLIVLATYSL